jgi:uncharacterized protein (DUF58 family)
MTRKVDAVVARLGDILTRDYLARYDPFIRWVRNPLAVLSLAAFASTLCGLYLHPRAFILAAGLVAVLGVGTAWPWVAIRGLSGTLSFGKARAREGEPVAVILALRNRMPWGTWGLAVRGAVLDRDGGAVDGIEHAAGWATTEARWDLVPDCRGEYPRTAPRVVSAFPFGLREASRPLEAPERLLVWPRTFPVGPIPETAGGRGGAGLSPRDKPGTTGDPLGVRPYRRGDPLRRVHWPQTARQDQLIVCELQADAVPRVQVVLDARPEAHAGEGPDGSLEWAIRIAASFAEAWIGEGAEVEVIAGARALATTTGTVRARQARVLDALARLRPDGSVSLSDVLDGPAWRRFGGGLRVVVATDLGLSLSPATRRGASPFDRYVVLHAAAFAGGEPREETGPLPVRPWIWIDDASHVPQLLRRRRNEVALAH